MERYSLAGSYMLGSKRRRYAVFDMLANTFSLWLSEESALLDDRQPELKVQVRMRRWMRMPFPLPPRRTRNMQHRPHLGAACFFAAQQTLSTPIATFSLAIIFASHRPAGVRAQFCFHRISVCSRQVKFAVRRPQKEPDTFDFAFSAADAETADANGFSSRFFEFTCEREAQQLGWLEALPPPREFTVKGYLHKKRFGAMKFTDSFDLRYAVRALAMCRVIALWHHPHLLGQWRFVIGHPLLPRCTMSSRATSHTTRRRRRRS